MTPIHANLKKHEGYVYKKSMDKRKKVKPKLQINDLVRTADLRDKHLLTSDTTIWSYRLYEFIEIVKDTISSYRIDNLPELYNKALLKKTDPTMKENTSIMKKLKLSYVKHSLSITAHVS